MNVRNRMELGLLMAMISTFAMGQGLYVESKDSGSTSIQKFFFMPQKFRSELPNGRFTIVRLDRNLIYSVDSQRKVYKEETFQSMKDMVDRARIMMRKRLEGLPPDRRTQLEEQLSDLTGDRGSAKYEVVHGNDRRSISGFSCTKVLIKKNGKQSEAVWVTKDIAGIERLRKDMITFTERLGGVLGAERIGQGWLKEVDAFPIQTERPGFTNTVTFVAHRAIDPAAFEVPAGYTKHEIKGLETPEAGERK